MYRHTQDRSWLRRARAYTAAVLPVASWTGTHDLGFMIGGPAGLGMQADPDPGRGAEYSRSLVRASRSLSSRWNPQVRAIRSGEYGGQWGLIIDSAMNAPMLIQAGQVEGGAQGRALSARGLRHMLTLIRYFIRPDGSTRHRLGFDPRTGRLLGAIPGQGLGPSSTWARGQAWAVDGFAHAYRLTRDERLLDAARRTADLWMARVPAGCVPAWDLDATSPAAPRDSSAAAILADGLLTLALAEPDAARATGYRAYALATLGTLASPPWLDPSPQGRGVLQRQAYDVPHDPREGTYSWGDAYLLAALSVSG
jgi:unsaturated chondroitin disaccharide hydrolase